MTVIISPYFTESIEGPLRSLNQFLTTESPLKMMKKAFNSNLKAISALKKFFCPNLFGHVGKRLDKNAKVNFKTYSSAGKQIITIHMLSNIFSRKDNQTMKFGQLVKYNMRNIFLEKSYIKCGGETRSRPFLKIKVELIS